MKKRNLIITISILGLTALDQITKAIIVANVGLGERINVIKNFFVITHAKNDGIAYGMLDDNMLFLYIVSIFAAGLFVFLLKDVDLKSKKLYSFAVILMAAGGLGNFIDRILYQEVTDFLSLIVFGKTIFGVFNVADICLVIGMVIFAIDVLLEDVLKWNKS